MVIVRICIKWRKISSTFFNVSNVVRRGGVLLPKLVAIYVDDLSLRRLDLAMCKSGCYIDDQCMNHVMYADDICLLASSAIGLQRMLDVCLDLSIGNNIKFNPIKYVCLVFKPKGSKLYCPNVRLDCDIL